MTGIELCIVEKQLSHRERLTQRAHDVLGVDALKVIEYGSSRTPSRDLYGDVDLWVVVPDGIEGRMIENRQNTYSDIGGNHLSYERPRFAPIEGMHSIVMYEGPVVSQEFDITIIPERNHHLYEGFLLANPGDGSEIYPWRDEEESTHPRQKLSYLLCAAFWTIKYTLRGETGRLAWLLKRYDEARTLIPELQERPCSWEDESRLFDTVSELVESVEIAAQNILDSSEVQLFERFNAVPKLGSAALFHFSTTS